MLVRRLQERSLHLTDTDGLRPVVLVDEGHDLRPDVLGIVRLLTNFEMDSRLVTSVVLCGQVPLRTLLRRDELEDVARRLAHVATLRLLTREETHTYVDHRLAVAGASGIFDEAARDTLFEIGRGNLRATDQLARKSLELVHQAGRDVVGANDVTQARTVLWP